MPATSAAKPRIEFGFGRWICYPSQMAVCGAGWGSTPLEAYGEMLKEKVRRARAQQAEIDDLILGHRRAQRVWTRLLEGLRG